MSFNNVIGGKLNLKGGALPVVGGVKKKKKKKPQTDLALTMGEAHADGGEGAGVSPNGGSKLVDRRTEAEKRYEEKAKVAEARVVSQMAAKSNREKVQEFNAYLGKLSEHYDIPRVGPG